MCNAVELNLKCPNCERKIKTPFMKNATLILKRTCQGCRECYQVKVTPYRANKLSGWIHVVEFVRLGYRQKKRKK